MKESLLNTITNKYEDKEKRFGPEIMRLHERFIILQIIDSQWKDHLYSMDYLKEGIGLRGYGQRDPLVEYKRESFEIFQAMMERIEDEVIRYLFILEPAVEQEERKARRQQDLIYTSDSDAPVKKKPLKREHKKVGRNDPCPCGSGKKYKKCCYLKGIKYVAS